MADEAAPQEPQEAPTDAAVNNPAPQDAKEDGGVPPGTLSQLYDTAGSVQAGLDVRRQEADEDKKQLLEQEKTLLEQRAQAEQADDAEAFAHLTKQLQELWEAWGVLNEDDDGEPADAAGSDQHADGEGDRRSERDSERAAGAGGQPG